ncbi:hypothetical protein [Pontibacter amylolyticus]|uniref:DUF304 domain-containing protein n=1 Tax=Pontibacter amylolyticus TaxID=1424080 RepID=A0ABQ1W925_9BACT|nr:hypothetical protein [Pontibacter amylolyticus]GGG19689.1 hypothetical protein GCM10011323_24750 [Pontibacter amylolyticus]
MPTAGNARSSLLVQLSPSRNAKLSFTVQLVLTLFWLAWATMLLVSENPTDDQNYLYYIFFGLAVVFLGYVILQNTSVFGVQSYIEVTQEYIVQKNGVFRTKMITAIPDIESVHVSPMALRITQRDGNKVYLDLKQIRKKRDIEKVKSRIRDLSRQHNFDVTEANLA